MARACRWCCSRATAPARRFGGGGWRPGGGDVRARRLRRAHAVGAAAGGAGGLCVAGGRAAGPLGVPPSHPSAGACRHGAAAPRPAGQRCVVALRPNQHEPPQTKQINACHLPTPAATSTDSPPRPGCGCLPLTGSARGAPAGRRSRQRARRTRRPFSSTAWRRGAWRRGWRGGRWCWSGTASEGARGKARSKGAALTRGPRGNRGWFWLAPFF
jgi:hypothetical protein